MKRCMEDATSQVTEKSAEEWTWKQWLSGVVIVALIAGAGYAAGYALKSSAAWWASIVLAVAITAALSRRSELGPQVFFVISVMVVGVLCSLPTWLVTWAVACRYDRCPFS